MKEIRSALASIEGNIGAKADLVAFDAPVMAMAEVAYEIRENCDVMVGAEGSMHIDGFPYGLILNDLILAPLKPCSSARSTARLVSSGVCRPIQ